MSRQDSSSRKRIFRFGVLFTLATLLCLSSVSWAYDIDTHFYEMYTLAIYAGFKPAIAAQMAMYDAQIDNSALTSAMSPIPFVAEVMRRLYHFPMPLTAYADHGAIRIFGKSKSLKRYLDRKGTRIRTHGVKLDLVGLVDTADTFSRTMFVEGLKELNWQKVCSGLHTEMDRFGHASCSFIIGHAIEGHWPDRPFADADSIAKHDRMTAVLFRDLVALRSMMPENALDKTFGAQNGKPNYLMSAEELQEAYLKEPNIRRAIENDPFRDPRYTRTAVEYILKRAQNFGIIKPSLDVDKFVSNDLHIPPGQTVRQILTDLITKIFDYPPDVRAHYIDMSKLRSDLLPDLAKRFKDLTNLSAQEKQDIVQLAVFRLTDRLIPAHLTDIEHQSYEIPTPLRELEMRIRLHDWRKAIEGLVGRRIVYEKPTNAIAVMGEMSREDRKQLAQEIQHLNAAVGKGGVIRAIHEAIISRVPEINEDLNKLNVVQISFLEKLRWSFQMFKYGIIDGLLLQKRNASSPETMIIDDAAATAEFKSQLAAAAGVAPENYHVLSSAAVSKLLAKDAAQQASKPRKKMCNAWF